MTSSESGVSSDEDEWEPNDADLIPSDVSSGDEVDESPDTSSKCRKRGRAASKKRPSAKTDSVSKLDRQAFDNKPKLLSSYFMSDDSSSSSNEFEKAPPKLSDLPKSRSWASKDDRSGINPELYTVDEPQNEEKGDSSSKGPVEYYDFTSILKTQAELKTFAKQMEIYTSKEKSDPSVLELKVEESSRKTKKRPNESSSKSSSRTKSSPSKRLEIDELLKIGEKSAEAPTVVRRRKRKNRAEDVDDEMVVVSDLQESDDDLESSNPQDVQLTITIPNRLGKKKNSENVKHLTEMARMFNEKRRKLQVLFHKVTLLGYLAHGNMLNDLVNSEEIRASALSIVPSKNFYPSGSTSLAYIERIVKWFNKNFTLDRAEDKISLEIVLNDFERKKASNLTSLVVMFAAMCRQLDVKCRILMSLRPCPIKPPSSETMKLPKEEDDDDCFKSRAPIKKSKPGPSNAKKKVKLAPSTSSPKSSKNAKIKTLKHEKESDDDDDDSSTYESPMKKSKPGPSNIKKKGKSTPAASTPKSSKKTAKSSKKKPEMSIRKVLSSDASDGEEATPTSALKKGVDLWTEIYDESEEKWTPADVARAQVNDAMTIGNGATKPLMYVVGWNADGSLKDLTMRYASQWLTTTPKLRVDPSWWKETLRPWAPRKSKMEKEENKKLDEEVAASPIPKSINDCKNHPFYALERHLLKYEAIFPPNAVPIGYVRGEPVYSRVCVTTLHTKETWMRKAKAVRLGEEPYKVVKARPKHDKGTGAVIKDLPLPLFGYWQVEDYIPPPAVNGVVPKNDFGNVELYRPCMLPPGTVHIQVPGIPKVAKKLGIDFAPAVVDWEFHSGGSHPIFDGVIVCEEFQDVLMDAWNVAIDEDAQRAKQKSRARAVKNWKKLIRSVLIRKRIEKRCKIDLSNVKVP